jgi:hypothetical protein
MDTVLMALISISTYQFATGGIRTEDAHTPFGTPPSAQLDG